MGVQNLAGRLRAPSHSVAHAAPSAARVVVALHHPCSHQRAQIGALLERMGFDVLLLGDPAASGQLRQWIDQRFDLLVINPFLGWANPAAVVRLARSIAGSRPIVALTPHDCVDERLVALENGADDALALSGNEAELILRIAALLRRSRISAGVIECADLAIDLVDRRVSREGRIIRLPLREFDLLANLARTPDRAIPSQVLLRAVWRIDFDPGTNRVAVHVSRLRGRIDHGFSWPMLHTVKGEGYALRSSRP
jgi:two-component system OmpR family response regulator